MQSSPHPHADSGSTRSLPGRRARLAALALTMLALGAGGGCGATAVQGTREPAIDPPLPAGSGLRREDVRFACGEVQCAAWLYLPRPSAAAGRPPVVVMAHGFGGTRRLFLPAYAERFAERGLAVFVFDYRSFGDSEGEPRQIVSVGAQLEDWRAALRHVRERSDVDTDRLALWGTSLSGGHVVILAAEDPGVRATVAQVPYIDGDAGEPAPWSFRLRALLEIARDYGRSWVGREPRYVPILAEPGSFGAISSADAYAAKQRLIPESLGWRNEIAARGMLELATYRPLERAARLETPLLLQPAREDELIPAEAIARYAESLPRAELDVLDGGHFDSYGGPAFERAVAVQIEFLTRALLGSETGSDPSPE